MEIEVRNTQRDSIPSSGLPFVLEARVPVTKPLVEMSGISK